MNEPGGCFRPYSSKRNRTSSACAACARIKSKCEAIPGGWDCRRCARLGLECVYRSRKRRGAADPDEREAPRGAVAPAAEPEPLPSSLDLLMVGQIEKELLNPRQSGGGGSADASRVPVEFVRQVALNAIRNQALELFGRSLTIAAKCRFSLEALVDGFTEASVRPALMASVQTENRHHEPGGGGSGSGSGGQNGAAAPVAAAAADAAPATANHEGGNAGGGVSGGGGLSERGVRPLPLSAAQPSLPPLFNWVLDREERSAVLCVIHHNGAQALYADERLRTAHALAGGGGEGSQTAAAPAAAAAAAVGPQQPPSSSSSVSPSSTSTTPSSFSSSGGGGGGGYAELPCALFHPEDWSLVGQHVLALWRGLEAVAMPHLAGFAYQPQPPSSSPSFSSSSSSSAYAHKQPPPRMCSRDMYGVRIRMGPGLGDPSGGPSGDGGYCRCDGRSQLMVWCADGAQHSVVAMRLHWHTNHPLLVAQAAATVQPPAASAAAAAATATAVPCAAAAASGPSWGLPPHGDSALFFPPSSMVVPSSLGGAGDGPLPPPLPVDPRAAEMSSFVASWPPLPSPPPPSSSFPSSFPSSSSSSSSSSGDDGYYGFTGAHHLQVPMPQELLAAPAAGMDPLGARRPTAPGRLPEGGGAKALFSAHNYQPKRLTLSMFQRPPPAAAAAAEAAARAPPRQQDEGGLEPDLESLVDSLVAPLPPPVPPPPPAAALPAAVLPAAAAPAASATQPTFPPVPNVSNVVSSFAPSKPTSAAVEAGAVEAADAAACSTAATTATTTTINAIAPAAAAAAAAASLAGAAEDTAAAMAAVLLQSQGDVNAAAVQDGKPVWHVDTAAAKVEKEAGSTTDL